MKKVISLSAVIMLSFIAFAQENAPKSKSHSNPNNNLDTVPKHNNLPKDTASKNWNNQHRTDSLNSNTSTNTMSSDSMNTSNSANSNPNTSGTMSSDSSSMSHNNQNMDSTHNATGTYNNNSNTTTTTPKSTTISSEDSIKAYEKTLTDRVMMKDDKMYLLKSGEATLLEKSYKLSSGAVVSTLGTVKYPGGKVITLKNGQFIETKTASTETGVKKTTRVKTTSKAIVTKKRVKTQSN